MYIRRNSSRLGNLPNPGSPLPEKAQPDQIEPDHEAALRNNLLRRLETKKLSWVVGAVVLAGVAWLVTRPLPQKGESTTYTFPE